jgi:hypothetical protein
MAAELCGLFCYKYSFSEAISGPHQKLRQFEFGTMDHRTPTADSRGRASARCLTA